MRSIVISNGKESITLMRDLVFTVTPSFVGEKAIMASGKTVMDYVGIKNVIEIPTGWLSPSDLSRLRKMIFEDHILTVSYPDLDGDRVAKFLLEPPVLRAFKYGATGVEQWYGVTIRGEEQEVDK